VHASTRGSWILLILNNFPLVKESVSGKIGTTFIGKPEELNNFL
jgi:hypothetical protein